MYQQYAPPRAWGYSDYYPYYSGPHSNGRGMHRRPGKPGKGVRFCPACGLAHNDTRLTMCRDPGCAAQLTAVVPPPGGNETTQQQGHGQQQAKNAGHQQQQQARNAGHKGTIKPPPPSQMPAGGGLTVGEVAAIKAIETQQLRKQELDDQGCWPPASSKDGEVKTLTAEQMASIAKLKSNIAALQSQPEEMQDQEMLAMLNNRLTKLVGKQPTPVGEQRASAKLTHFLGKLRSTYAADKEACIKETKDAHAALEAAQARVIKAAEWEDSIDKDFAKREERIQSILAQVTTDTQTAKVPTVHLPDAKIHYTLPVDVLGATLSGVVQDLTGEYNLEADGMELKIMNALCSRIMTQELQTTTTASASMDLDLLGDTGQDTPCRRTTMAADSGDAWATPIPNAAEEEADCCYPW